MPAAVISSVHPYSSGLIVGSHQIARELARRGWHVLLLSDPASLAHMVAAIVHHRARARCRAATRGLVKVDGVLALTPWTLVPLARDFGAGSARLLAIWPRASWPYLPRLLRELGFERPELALLDTPLAASAVDALAPKRLVMRLFDDTSEEKPWPPALQRAAEALAARADLVAITAPMLAPHAERLGARRIHLMPNGADLQHFTTPRPPPPELASIARPRVVYSGALAPWVDYEWMNTAARRLPGISFLWIGPGPTEAVQRLPNVFVLGPRPYDSLPAYLQHCDVGVIPFDRRRFPRLIDSVHPLKLYDYLAAGLAVVATRSAELERIAAPVALADSPDEFVTCIVSALRGGPAPAAAFLASATWQARVDALLARLQIA